MIPLKAPGTPKISQKERGETAFFCSAPLQIIRFVKQ